MPRAKAEPSKAVVTRAEKPKTKKATEDKKKKKEKKALAPAKKDGKRRRKSGQLAMKEMRQLQKTTHRLLAKAPFTRMVRSSMMAAVERIQKPFLAPHFKPAALECLQDAAEAYMLRFFEDAQTACLHAGRKTLMQKDMAFVRRLRPELLQGRKTSGRTAATRDIGLGLDAQYLKAVSK
eukprot:TRINITY_DN4029_c0_g2_i1.p1 TRINITY_DN4029_c0_g2~~TRINITY_DN4029_c0_g2_i1.p1  ORF type:complete len:179 (+),score=88.82 TRINITY_DN4029_c0_g2_i1:67-603(+)